MANEGSTKPTYSELETQNAYLTGELSKRDKGLETLRERIRNLEIMNGGNKTSSAHYREELARVRGLLQRAIELLRTVLKASDFYSTTSLKQLIREFVAESADIGKLDRADEGIDEEYARYEQYLYGWKAHEAKHKMLTFSGWAREERKLVGSAETGGEKAAPQNSEMTVSPVTASKSEHAGIATADKSVEYSSQNQNPNACQECGRDNPVWFADSEVWNTVIPDRVGFLCPICFIAHAKAADFKCTGWKLVPENWESREPEKLNNAQPVCNICCDKKCICDEYGHQNPHNSESSLSSPPPEDSMDDVCMGCYHSLGLCVCGTSAAESAMTTTVHRHLDFAKREIGNSPAVESLIDAIEAMLPLETTFRQSPSLSESGPESVHFGKQNTADKSGVLPTQLPKEK